MIPKKVTDAQLRIRFGRLIVEWVPLMGLTAWGLEVQFDETEALASCSAKPRYEEALIRFNLQRIRAELPNTIAAAEELVVHELAHCIIWKNSEVAVSRVTRALLRSRDRGRGEP